MRMDLKDVLDTAIATSRLGEVMGVKSREVWVGGILDGHGRGRQCKPYDF